MTKPKTESNKKEVIVQIACTQHSVFGLSNKGKLYLNNNKDKWSLITEELEELK